MEYVYACMLLHEAGQTINEASVKKVLEAAGVKADEARIKAVVAALYGVDIKKAIEEAAHVPVAAAAPAAAAGGEQKAAEKKEEKKDEKSAEQASAGLGALFG